MSPSFGFLGRTCSVTAAAAASGTLRPQKPVVSHNEHSRENLWQTEEGQWWAVSVLVRGLVQTLLRASADLLVQFITKLASMFPPCLCST